MNNILGLILSFAFVFAIIGLSSMLKSFNLLSNESSRKFIHIGVSNWWILAMMFFNNILYVSIVPATFVIINYISYRNQIFTAMERDGSAKDLGTVYYAVSLLILCLLTFNYKNMSYIGAIGILIMGYGDGFAAIVGEKFGKHKYSIMGNKKTLEGTITMFLFSFIISCIILFIYNPYNLVFYSLILALFSTILESFSPLGLDNLTVPLGASLIYYLLLTL